MAHFRPYLRKAKNLTDNNIKDLTINQILFFLGEKTEALIHEKLQNELKKKLNYNFKNLLLMKDE